MVSVNTSGTYTLIVTNEDNGCTETATVDVDQDVDLPDVDAGPNASISCVETDATLDGSASESGPNITYVWEDEMGTVVGNTAIILVDEVGVYTLIVTNNDTGLTRSTVTDPNGMIPDCVYEGTVEGDRLVPMPY